MVGSLLRALSCFDDGKEALAVGYFFTFVSIVLAFCGLSFWGFPAFFFFFFTKLSILHKTLSSVGAFRLATRQRVSYALFSVMRLFT